MFTRLALRARIATLVIMALIIAGGAFTLSRLQVELLPDVDFPLVTVSAFYPGADMATVLRDVSQPLEKTTHGLEGLRTVRSITSPNFSLILAEFDFGTDMKRVERVVAEKVRASALPPSVQPPRVARVNPDEFPVLELSAIGQRDVADLHRILSTQVIPLLQQTPGVFSAELPLGSESGMVVSRTNGLPSLPITIIKHPDSNTVEVVIRIMERLREAQSTLPPDVQFITIANQAPDIQNSISTLTREVFLGGILAVLVIFAFLLNVRPTIVSGIAIPVSLLGGLIVLGLQGMSLNIITLGGLAIAVGRVVDDSIVVMENIYRHRQRGEEALQAALAGTREVAGAITSSTLTTIAVFAPLGFMGGIIGSFFFPFALTVTYCLLASLLVALTIVPVLGSFLIQRRGDEPERETRLQRVYTPFLRWALAHKLATIAIALVLFVGSLGLLSVIPVSFLPSSTQGVLTAQVNFPPGTAREAMTQQVEEIERVLASKREQGTLMTYQVTVGSDGNPFRLGAGAGGAGLLAVLHEDANPEQVTEALRRELAGPGREVTVAQAEGGGPQGNTVQITLFAEDTGALASAADQIVGAIKGVGGLINVRSDAVTPGDASATQIVRVNGRSAVTVTGAITAENTQRVNQEVNRILAQLPLPSGVEIETGGAFQDINEVFTQMGIAMATGVGLVLLVMLLTLRSFVTPFIIIFSLPLASIGALGALAITQRALGLPALMGILMLIGLVVTNAIVLIVFVEQLRAQGRTVSQALVEGGRTRLRPILMTAFTTVFALLPLAVLPGDKSGIIGAELATVVIGGLITSTFLTLVVIPVVYNLVRRDRGRPVPTSASADPASVH
ncbi:MAG: efflux RND transporter permease subunit [Dehalococcoidia bacterium]|nr:efflux RND transporter permease subunit [Dehalococcoidia bacterium]